MKLFNTQTCIADLAALGDRQLTGEHKAREYIENALTEAQISYITQEFEVRIPRYDHVSLIADGVDIPALGSCFVSGAFDTSTQLLSSLTSSQDHLYESNINYNPSSDAISRNNHYFAPSVAIHRDSVAAITSATSIIGEVRVTPVAHTSANILVGNIANPKTIVFSHYDSIQSGAVDNASGVAASFDIILNHQELLNDHLFVIAGNEEISYDEPIYWGHGYRVFEQGCAQQLITADSIIVLDSFGHSQTITTQDPEIIMLGFPLSNINQYTDKVSMVTGDIDALMQIYHSNLDTPEKINQGEIEKARDLTVSLMTR